MCADVPVMMTIYLRVHRLKRVFELYENYLKTSRVTLANQLVNRKEQDIVKDSSYASRYSMLQKTKTSEFSRKNTPAYDKENRSSIGTS